jgi:hypothetical protein
VFKQLSNSANSFNPLRRSLIVGVLLLSAALLPSAAMAATMRVEIRIAAPVDEVWAAVRDVGAVHTRLAPGFVVDDRLEEGVRTITFASGLVVKEIIVSIDDENHRLGYSASGSRSRFHFASIEIVPGAIVMRKTLEAAARARH